MHAWNSIQIFHIMLLCTEVASLSYFFITAASLLKGLKHANIVTLHDIIHTSTNLTFVFEYVVSYSAQFTYIVVVRLKAEMFFSR